MNALFYTDKDATDCGPREGKPGRSLESGFDEKRSLLLEISQLGGPDKLKGVEGALAVIEKTLAELVEKDPEKYGVKENSKDQRRVVRDLAESIGNAFLRQTVETLRHEAGYIRIRGRWIHRAVFAFLAFGLLLAGLIPVCAVSLMSDSQWGWLPGVVGMAIAFVVGVWIFSRVRSR